MTKSIKIFYVMALFFVVYVLPMIVSYFDTGAILQGNIYQLEKAYINSSSQLILHLSRNFSTNANIFTNSIFIFFVSALMVQNFIKWMLSDD